MILFILLAETANDFSLINSALAILGGIGGMGLPIYIAVTNNINKKKDRDLEETNKKKDRDLQQKIAESESKQTDKLNEKYSIVIERLDQNEIATNRFEKLLINHLNEDALEKDIIKATIDVTSDINKNNSLIPGEHKSVISFWASLMQKFASKYLRSSEKKQSKRRRAKLLKELKRELISKFSNYIDSNSVSVKEYNGKPVKLSAYIHVKNMYQGLNNLVMYLEENGKTTDEILEEFATKIDDFCEDYMELLESWKDLKQWEDSPKSVRFKDFYDEP